ncbi:MAG TPA: hypothetical protein VGL02_18375 [Streptomyces sp.]
MTDADTPRVLMRPVALPDARVLIDRIRASEMSVADPPTKVCLCGSTRFWGLLAEANLRFTAAGAIVLAPGVDMKRPHELWTDPEAAARLKRRLDRLHRHKIADSAHVVVVTDETGYAGSSTRGELAYAQRLGITAWHWRP